MFCILFSAALFILSCDKTKTVLKIRVDAPTMTINCVDEYELTFRPTGDTHFTGSSQGTWADGAIAYGMEEREGQTLFVVRASGDWVAGEIQNNPSPFHFEILIKNIDSTGTFETIGYWKYRDVVTGEARNPIGAILILPDPDNVYTMRVERLTDDLCLTHPADAETEPEVVEVIDPSEDFPEDIPGDDVGDAEEPVEAVDVEIDDGAEQ